MKRLFTQKQRLQILVRDNWTCGYCGEKLHPGGFVQIDHVIPVSKGGLTTVSNGLTSCRACNAKKGARFCENVTA
jgi:5-methylcytosine-specific restriction endonuclease McrA